MKLTSGRVLVGLASILLSSQAIAARPAPHVMELARGVGGPQAEEGGAGNEQPSVATVVSNGRRYIVTVYMSSDVANADRPWQCKCTSVEMDPVRGPMVIADQIQITTLNGNRPCNHPKIAAADDGTMIWTYGSNDNNQATVKTYVQAINHQCNLLSNPLKISNDNNNNEGAPDIIANSPGRWTAGYLSTGNNDRSVAVGLNVQKNAQGRYDLDIAYRTTVVAPSNIGRPTMVPMSNDRTLFCAAKGDNRPPEDGVECAMLNTTNGRKIWGNVVAASQPNQNIYQNQPQVALMDNGRVALMTIQSSGEGRRRNQKGASMSHVFVLAPDDSGPGMLSRTPQVGTYQTHSTICSGAYGEGTETQVGLFDASITGSGLASLTMVRYDLQQRALVTSGFQAAGAFNGDSGYIANIYGQNPNTQGRDFLRCIGNVPNPGFMNPTGFRPEVANFFVLPYAGRKPNEPKNALFLSLVPGQVPAPPPTPTFEVTVRAAGSGRGNVVSTPSAIDCGQNSACAATFDQGTMVTLVATPAADSTFDGFTGDCMGSAQCTLNVTAARNVSAFFSKKPTGPNLFPVSVSIAGDGAGIISSTPAGLSCGAGLTACTATFDKDTSVVLRAQPADGSNFVGWEGDCSGTAECTVTIITARAVIGRFAKIVDPMNPGTPNPAPNIKKPDTNPGTGEPMTMTENPPANNPTDDTSVGCSTAGKAGGGTFPALLLAGIFVLVARRRRR